MADKELLKEIEENKAEVEKVLHARYITKDGKKENVTNIDKATYLVQPLGRMLDLVRYCLSVGEMQVGLELSTYAKKVTKWVCEVSSGMKMQELNDYIIAHKDVADPRYDMYWEFMLEETPYLFESFMLYMERNRPYTKKFYEPRMYTKSGKPALKLVANELQAFEGRKYKFLGISMPSRTGKSTICIFYLCWKALRFPNSHSAMGGHAGTLVKGFYKELLNLMTSKEYCYFDIYGHMHPNHQMITDKSAEDYTITLDEPDRFATITCRGIDASWTGAVDVSKDGVLYVDDLVRDRQHSLSPNRMEETFQEYLNKMVDRKNDGAQELMVGTLWNVLDPLERIRKANENNPEYRFLRIPALDDNGESNFDYIVNGFSTKYYNEMKKRLDNAEWQAKFQQQPYVREGLLFPLEELLYFNGEIINSEIKRVFAVCDPAFGGGDNLSMPVCLETVSGRKRIISWIYDKRTTKYTIPRIVNAIQKYQISELRLERNGAGLMLEGNIKEEMKRQGVFGCKVVSVSAPNRMSKEDKIKGYSDFVKDNFEFIQAGGSRKEYTDGSVSVFVRDSDYDRALEDMGMYTSEGKNLKDDAPDSMVQMAMAYEKKRNGQIEVLHNPFGEGSYSEWY